MNRSTRKTLKFKKRFLGLILVLTGALICSKLPSHAAHDGLLHEMEVFEEISRIGSSTGMSLAPILAYEPTFGFIFGGAIFLEKPFAPNYAFNGRIAFSAEGEYSVLTGIKKYYSKDRFYHIELELDDFARPYYGEGMDTDRDERIFLEGTVLRFLYFLKYLSNGKVSMGPFLDIRGAKAEGVDGMDVPAPEYDELTLGLGMRFFYDVRDNSLSPTSGLLDTLTIRFVPEPFSTYDMGNAFLQAEIDHRIFYSPFPGTVLAGRIFLGGTWGDPSYQYIYSLGGPYELRGFFTNRFRGKSVYVAQGEIRKDLFWIFSGAVFAEIGEVSDGRFETPEKTYGAGLRMTLPPDHIAKVRMDFAWAKDQKSIYFIFGEAF